MAEADQLLEALQAGECHLSTEATVIALGVLSANPREYSSRIIAISGTCKTETVEKHQELIQRVVDTCRAAVNITNTRIYYISTDGDGRRRRSIANIALSHSLPRNSPLYSQLGRLSLFNLRCGEDEITADCDAKHLFKRCQGACLRLKGIKVQGYVITTNTLLNHLTHSEAGENSETVASSTNYRPLSRETARALLFPDDKQDVLLSLRFMRAVIALPLAAESASPGFRTARQSIRLLGRFFFHLIEPYTNLELSLSEQLNHISTAGHLLLAIYRESKGDFIPSQLYYDIMTHQKNVYFSVAKTKNDNPTGGSFWLSHIGTDRLETTFGHVRTIEGSDSNVDQLQLTSRIAGATQCALILAQHPEWDQTPRRLRLTAALTASGDDISRKFDHINPTAWRGDVRVGRVVLITSWRKGRQQATKVLGEFGHSMPFENMEEEGGYDMLCPFGKSKIVLLSGLNEGEVEGDEEDDTSPGRSGQENAIESGGSFEQSDTHLEPDLEDLVGSGENNTTRLKDNAWLEIGSKKIHKASVCRLYSNPFAIQPSSDRLKRVRGFSKYDTSSTIDIDTNSAFCQDSAQGSYRYTQASEDL